MGPQVGYYVPQILMEEDLHGPTVDARGASFPGVNLYVQLGHGRDYAWSATTATSDNVDTFAEVLCQDDFHYRYKGQCLPMEKLDRNNSWIPNASDKTPPGSETLTAYRTVHGIVYARGTSGGQRVAYASARTTYFHEADSALGFSQYNDPGFMTSPQQFQRAASNINFGFNWAYIDAGHIAYYHSGWYPQRSQGTSPDFPVLGTGEYDWQGYDPSSHTQSLMPFESHPNAIDPDYLVSWNNKQAPGWSAADDKYSFGPVYRSQMIEGAVRDALAGGKTMRSEQLVTAMDEAATDDIRVFALWPILKQVLGSPTDPRLQEAIARIDRWYAQGGHRRDLDRNGTDENDDAITLLDAWWPKLLDAEFKPALGSDTFTSLRGMLDIGGPIPGTAPSAPDFADGWYGYVSKDLRDLLANSRPRSRAHCRISRIRTRGRGGRVRVRRVRNCANTRARVTATTTGRRAAAARKRRHSRQKVRRRVSSGRGWSRVYCGGGSLTACRSQLQRSLLDALSVSHKDIYGQTGECTSNPQASCFDANRSTIASGVSIDPFPFQNRPTFQQVVEPTHTLPR
jgi:hypothetical protein